MHWLTVRSSEAFQAPHSFIYQLTETRTGHAERKTALGRRIDVLRLDISELRISYVELCEDVIHDSGGQKDFAVRDWHLGSFNDRSIERLDQIFHARLHVEISCQESLQIRCQVPEIL